MNLEKTILDMFEGLSSIDFNIIIQYSSLLFVIFWLVVTVWVWFDSTERIDSFFLRLLAVVVVLFGNIPGLIIYLILRPKMTASERYWSDLERRYLMYETSELEDCEKCGEMLQPGFVFCPSCKEKVKVKCNQCGVNIDRKWKNCPYCGLQNADLVQSSVKVVRYESFSEFLTRIFTTTKSNLAQKRALYKEELLRKSIQKQNEIEAKKSEKKSKKSRRKDKKNKNKR